MERTNGTPILLKQVTEIRDGLRKETVVVEANGLYYIKGDTVYLTFDEQYEGRTVKNVVKIHEDEVVVLRSGAVRMRHTFRKHKETVGVYENDMARWSLKTKTDEVRYQYNEKAKKGQLFFSYILQLAERDAGRYKVTILFREERT